MWGGKQNAIMFHRSPLDTKRENKLTNSIRTSFESSTKHRGGAHGQVRLFYSVTSFQFKKNAGS
jgi:hypothetical protein